MKKLVLNVLTLGLVVGFNGCGSSDNSTPPNNNTYNLRAINKVTGISTLLKGGYSNGVKGSISVVRLDDGTDIINGIPVVKVKTNTSITLDNGYTSQGYSISSIDNNGFTLSTVDEKSTKCTLTTNAEIIPIAATVGTTSKGTAIYSCDDSTTETDSWSLSDAGNGNANYTFKSVTSGASQSEDIETVTITPQNKVIHDKIYVNVIAQGITGTFEGDVN